MRDKKWNEIKWKEEVCFEIDNFKEINVAQHVHQNTLPLSLNYAEIIDSMFTTLISKLSEMATALMNTL